MAIAAFAGGMLADQIGGFTAIAVMGTIGVVCSTGYFGLRSSTTPLLPAYTARSSFKTLLSKPVLRRVVVAHGFYGAGVVAAVPAVRDGPRGPAGPVHGPRSASSASSVRS